MASMTTRLNVPWQALLIICLATALVQTANAQRWTLDQAVEALNSTDHGQRARGFSALMSHSPSLQFPPNSRIATRGLLAAYPEQAERIKTALIQALEVE
jgi:hypothetical protein